MGDVSWGMFLIASLSLNAMPGADVVYITSKYNYGGWKAAIGSALGLATGYYFYVFLTWVGLTALLISKPSLFSFVQFAGALYIVWVGLKAMEQSSGKGKNAIDPQKERHSGSSGFLGGIFISILNPKVGLFFVSFLPQFTGPASSGDIVLILGSIFCIGATIFNFIYCFTLSQIERLVPSKSHSILGIAPGLVLVVLGTYMIYKVIGIA